MTELQQLEEQKRQIEATHFTVLAYGGWLNEDEEYERDLAEVNAKIKALIATFRTNQSSPNHRP